MKRRFIIFVTIIYMLLSFAPAYAAGDPYPVWKPVKRSKAYEKKGKWYEAARNYTNGSSTGVISCGTSISVSSTYNGELKISIPYLESYAMMQHKINKSFKVSVRYSESLKGKKKGTYAIFYRKVFTCRKVTQRKYYHVDGYLCPTKTTKKVRTKDFKSMSYKLKKISDKDVT